VKALGDKKTGNSWKRAEEGAKKKVTAKEDFAMEALGLPRKTWKLEKEEK